MGEKRLAAEIQILIENQPAMRDPVVSVGEIPRLLRAFAAPDDDALKPGDEVEIEGVEPPWVSGRFRFDAEDGPSHKTVQVSVIDGMDHIYLHVDPALVRKVRHE